MIVHGPNGIPWSVSNTGGPKHPSLGVEFYPQQLSSRISLKHHRDGGQQPCLCRREVYSEEYDCIGRCKADHYEYYVSHRRLEEGHAGGLLDSVSGRTLCCKGICGSRSNITYAHCKDTHHQRVVGLH
jgi:hypothetical protein